MQYPFEKFDKDINVTIKTNKGDIKLEVYGTKAPITVGNFVYLINKGFYKGIKFHRVINDFMIQTGDPNSKGVAGKDFVYDPYNNPNGLPIAGTGDPGRCARRTHDRAQSRAPARVRRTFRLPRLQGDYRAPRSVLPVAVLQHDRAGQCRQETHTGEGRKWQHEPPVHGKQFCREGIGYR